MFDRDQFRLGHNASMDSRPIPPAPPADGAETLTSMRRLVAVRWWVLGVGA